jgi:Spy/CpxP family protein refolding chaperone
MKIRMILMIASAGVMFAQGPRGPHGMGGPPSDGQPDLSDVTSYLSLTSTQVQSLQSISTQQRAAVRGVQQQIADKQRALDTLIQKGSTDAAALGNLLIDMQNLRKQVNQSAGTYQSQALAVLTPDQKTKLNNLQAAAQLQPAIHEAGFLGLLAPPQGANAGPGAGMRMGPGPRPFFGRPRN